MKETPESQLSQDKNRHIGAPSEACRDRYIDMRESEAGDEADGSGGADEAVGERQRQWREEIETGKRACNGAGQA